MVRLFPLGALLLTGCLALSDGTEFEFPDAGVDAAVFDAALLDGARPDAGSMDSGSGDAGSMDAGSRDAGSRDAGSDASGATCLPSAVRYSPPGDGGALAIGQICDEVFACVEASQMAAITTASMEFDCSEMPSGPCVQATCIFNGVGALDQMEIDEICAVSLVSPTPDIVCVDNL